MSAPLNPMRTSTSSSPAASPSTYPANVDPLAQHRQHANNQAAEQRETESREGESKVELEGNESKVEEDLEAEQRQQVGDIKQRSQQRKRERRRRRSSSSTTTIAIAGAAVERALQEGRGGDVTGEAATRPAAAVAGRSGE